MEEVSRYKVSVLPSKSTSRNAIRRTLKGVEVLREADGNSRSTRPEKKSKKRGWNRLVAHARRNLIEQDGSKHPQAVERDISRTTADSSAWMTRFNGVLAVVGLLTLWVLINQLKEMRSSGVDTKNLATSGGTQASQTTNLALAAEMQAERTKDLADRMKDQADQTRTIARQAIIQAKAARLSAEAAQSDSLTTANQLELSERPWVSARFRVAGPLVRDSDGVHATISITPENIGQSPAVKGFYTLAMIPFISDRSIGDPWFKRKELCDTVEQSSATAGSPGKGVDTSHTWFRGEDPTETWTVGMSNKDMSMFRCDTKTCDTGKTFRLPTIIPTIIACLAYQPPFKKARYHTSYVFEILRINPMTGEESVIPDTTGTVPANELRLLPRFGVGIDAK